ncbi:hypothetical protein QIS74_01246 [Colletotrichum tabaci]|uniref:Uncharacterized protein n=1 Tax=Colletotrichum tabaci TaxID=1209068 RepID=A0AAV9TNX7_9PEZI
MASSVQQLVWQYGVTVTFFTAVGRLAGEHEHGQEPRTVCNCTCTRECYISKR